MKLFIGLILLGAGLFGSSELHAQVPEATLSCESAGYRPNSCAIPPEMGTDVIVELVQQYSTGRGQCAGNWRHDSTRIYVDNGCRAKFRVIAKSFNKSCESMSYQPATCSIGATIARVELLQGRSTGRGACDSQPGGNWNFDSSNIYVSNGCRGLFKVILLGANDTIVAPQPVPPVLPRPPHYRPPPSHRPIRTHVVEGDIEGQVFSFEFNSVFDLDLQCQSFVSYNSISAGAQTNLVLDGVHQATLPGNSNYSNLASEICRPMVSFVSSVLQPTPYPGPQPVPPPVHYGPQCELMGSGSFNGYSYNYRIGLNGNALTATNDFTAMLEQLTRLSGSGACAIPHQAKCGHAGTGSFAGYSYNYRLQVGNNVIAATNDLNSYIATFSKLRDVGMCQRANSNRCEMAGSGTFAGYSYNYRLSVGNNIITASNDLDSLLGNISEFRRNGLCDTPPALRCELLGPGSFAGYSYNNRIAINGVTIYGGNDLNTVLSTMAKIRTQGLCF